jgi:hypothetical protein
MPIPTPKPNEAEGSFMSRCIRFVTNEGTPQEQAIAICSSQYRKEKLKVMTWKTIDRKRASYIKYAKTEFSRALKTQANEYLDKVKQSGISAEYSISRAPMENAMFNVYSRVMKQFARDTFSDLSKRANKTEVNWDEWVARWFTNNTTDLIGGIDTYTQNGIRIVAERAIIQGWGIREFQNALFEDYRISERRAELIGRTEIIRASNAGSLMGAQETGFPMQKFWLATRDNRTRGLDPEDIYDHYSMDEDKGIPLDQAFNVSGEQLQHPGDRAGSPGNTINCRCTMTYQVLDEIPEEFEAEAPEFKPTNQEFAEFGGDLPDETWRVLKEKTKFGRFTPEENESTAFYNYINNSVGIGFSDKYDTKMLKDRVLAHEYGHAIHFQNRIITTTKTDDVFDKYYFKNQDIFVKKYDTLNFSAEWYNKRISGEVYEKYRNRYTEREITTMHTAVADYIGGLTKGRKGYGHTRNYYMDGNNSKMEVFAISHENHIVGNPIFKDYFPDMYEETIKYMRGFYDVYGR